MVRINRVCHAGCFLFEVQELITILLKVSPKVNNNSGENSVFIHDLWLVKDRLWLNKAGLVKYLQLSQNLLV